MVSSYQSLYRCLPRCLLGVMAALALPIASATTYNVTMLSPLHFGAFTVLGSCVNCTITINPATGQRTSSGGVILRDSTPGQRAQYSVGNRMCGNNCSYTASIAPVNISTPGGTMEVINFTTSQTAISGPNGSNTLYVGGTLRIPSVNVSAGNYSVNFTVNTTP